MLGHNKVGQTPGVLLVGALTLPLLPGEALAERLESVSVVLKVRSGPTGRLYGAVTNVIVAQELSTMMEVEFDRRDVQLEDTIHELGTFQARVRLHPELTATVTLVVEATTE